MPNPMRDKTEGNIITIVIPGGRREDNGGHDFSRMTLMIKLTYTDNSTS